MLTEGADQAQSSCSGDTKLHQHYHVICYFIKGKHPAQTNFDAMRVAQLVELEHRLRCERVPSVAYGQYRKTKLKGRDKNPGDVWGAIKQLTYKSKELASRDALNTIQKPEKRIERLVLANSSPGDFILDPFLGLVTCPVVSKKHGRDFMGFEIRPEFVVKSLILKLHRVANSLQRSYQPHKALQRIAL